MSLRALLAAGLLLSAPAAASAHDFWIEPSSHQVAPGAAVSLGLRVGERLVGEAVPRNGAKIERFVVVGPAGEKAVPGRDGSDPAGAFEATEAGVHVVGYRSRRSAVELDARKFEAYLAEEGLERVVEERARRGESDARGVEVYSRCAKALVRAGDATGGHDRVLGLTLEVVPERSPFAMRPGEALPLRVLLEGRPAEGLLVVALSRAAPSAPRTARTDAEGRASLVLDRPGAWLVKTVHMRRAPPGTKAGPAPDARAADWESLWASLTFSVPAPVDAAAIPPATPPRTEERPSR